MNEAYGLLAELDGPREPDARGLLEDPDLGRAAERVGRGAGRPGTRDMSRTSSGPRYPIRRLEGRLRPAAEVGVEIELDPRLLGGEVEPVPAERGLDLRPRARSRGEGRGGTEEHGGDGAASSRCAL
jgi:hypothetical protein